MNRLNEVCGTSSTKPKNIGGKKQCLEAPVKTTGIAKDSFSFASLADAKNPAKWAEAILAKNIVPLPNIEGLELANTEASIKEGRYQNYELKEGVAGVKHRYDLSMCTYEAIKTYKDSEYTRLFEITNAEEISCDVQSDGTVKGRGLSSFIPGLRNQATDEDVPYVDVNIKFENDVYDIIQAPFDASALEGIFDIKLEVQSANATTIVVKASDACTGALAVSFVQSDWKLETGQTVTGSSYSAVTGFYTLTGSGLVAGVLSILPVTKSGIHLEGLPATVTV